MSTTEKKKPRKLSLKQKKFIAEYVKTGNGTQSIKKVYNVKNDLTARVMASENLTKPNVAIAIAEALPDELLRERHLELLNKRDIMGDVEVIAVSKGLDMAYKIKGAYAPEKTLNMNLNFTISDEDKKRLDDILNDNETD